MDSISEFLEQKTKKFNDFTCLEIRRGIRVERHTYAQINRISKQVAAFLKENDIQRGDRIILWGDNSPEWVHCFFGCLRLGAVVVPIDFRSTGDVAKKYIEQTQPKLFFLSQRIDSDFLPRNKTFFIEDIQKVAMPFPPLEDIKLSSNDLAEILFTSGTTGFPKGVMITHKNILYAIDAFAKSFPITPDFRLLSILPLSHIFEQVVGLFFPIQGGASIIYLARINSVTILKGIRYHKITAILVVPRILQLMFTKLQEQTRKQHMEEVFTALLGVAHFIPLFSIRKLLFTPLHQQLGGALQFLVSGAAPLDEYVGRAWERMGFTVYQGYGSTETTAVTTTNLVGKDKLQFAGKVAPHTAVKLAPDGEVLVKGPIVFSGYWQNNERTKESFIDGWYKTGDIGKFDPEGWLYLFGREKFRIVLPDGSKVYPEDIERKLNNYPKIKDSCVIGILEHGMKVLHAVLLTDYPRDGHTILATMNQQVEPHQQISHFSIWPEKDFPRLRTLKVDRVAVEKSILTEKEPILKGKVMKEKRIKIDELIEILSRISHISSNRITNKTNLVTDLHLDSLQRVELLAAIEQDLEAMVDEAKITPATTVGQLRKLIAESEIVLQKKRSSWPQWRIISNIRTIILQAIILPYHALFVPITVIGKENLKGLSDPTIFYYNHIGFLDVLFWLRILSYERRKKTAFVASVRNWRNKFFGFVQKFLINAYEFANEGPFLKESLEYTGELVDKGYSPVIAPEGATTPDGRILPFYNGIGLLAVELGVDVIGIKIQQDYLYIFPEFADKFRNLFPRKRQHITIKITKPMRFSKETSYEEATKALEDALRKL